MISKDDDLDMHLRKKYLNSSWLIGKVANKDSSLLPRIVSGANPDLEKVANE